MCETKKCIKCELDLPLDNFSKNKNTKDGLWVYCRNCCKIKKRIYYLENKQLIYKKTREYIVKHPKETKLYKQKYSNKITKELTDVYIKQTLTGSNKILTFKDIPPELIELQREHIKLIRKTKEINKQINN